MTEPTTIASHLARRFRELGVECGFGIVGDFALKMFSALDAEGFPILVTTDEQGAGFAADACARLKGFGVVAVTYGAGGLKVANAAANAWAEQVPMLILSGAPGVVERKGDPNLHHKVKDFGTQVRVFEELTCAQAVLTTGDTATNEIDRVLLEMLSQQRPGYIEVPRDLIGAIVDPPDFEFTPELPPVDQAALQVALAEVINALRESDRVAIHAGAMVNRRGVSDALFSLATTAGIPVATSSLARGVFPERHELGLGMYLGALTPLPVRERVEGADLVLSLGVLQTDLTLGGFTAHIDRRKAIWCSDTDVTVGFHTYNNVPLWAFLPALAQAVNSESVTLDPDTLPGHEDFQATDAALTVERTVHAINAHLDERHGILLDPGEALFSSVDMRVPTWALGSAYYATMGYAVPAALGAGKADPDRRPFVIVGDGAFVMTALEAASCAFHGVPAIILVLDNSGYGTQRPMMDGPFNDIAQMAPEKLVEVFGTGQGWKVDTEAELDTALTQAIATDHLCIIRAVLPKYGRSSALSRLGEALAAKA
jgi:TPP-dependent 2-oxoacid decarboxylase